jgi:hypothetical protein
LFTVSPIYPVSGGTENRIKSTVDYVVHGDEACASDFITVHIEGPYDLPGPSAVVAGAYDGVFSFTQKTITPGSAGAADFLNSLGSCGSFTEGVATDIYQNGCAPLGQYPAAQCSADYDVVSFDGQTLRFGARPADNNMCTPENRPTELSPVALTKKWT